MRTTTQRSASPLTKSVAAMVEGAIGVASLSLVIVAGVGCKRSPQPGHVLDEARTANRTVASLPAADEDYFHDMDGAVALTPDEIKGRNTWIVWTGGNDRFWDTISRKSVGTLDFLKTLSSHPGSEGQPRQPLELSRPGQRAVLREGDRSRPEALRPVAGSAARPDCPPIRSRTNRSIPAWPIGARGKNLPLGSFYGYATGIVGLRLFPNPDFDEAAAKKWDAERYYNDPSYYIVEGSGAAVPGRHVVRLLPRRPEPDQSAGRSGEPEVGRTSAPTSARSTSGSTASSPGRPTRPASSISCSTRARPGTLDTSLVSTDNINNPRTMNAVYELGARLELAQALRQGDAGGRRPRTTSSSTTTCKDGPLTAFFSRRRRSGRRACSRTAPIRSARSARSTACILNIGLFSEEWLLHFNALVGGKTTVADRDRGRAQELGVLGGDRGADARRGAVLPEERDRRTS